jgi:hypothetical protein
LLQDHQSRVLWLLHLELVDLILDLLSVVPAWLDTLLGVSDRLQHRPGIVQVVRIDIFLLAQLAEQNADLVGELRDGIVAGLLAPVGELGADREALLACGFVGADEVVLGLDETEEFLGQLRLPSSAQAGEREATARAPLRAAALVLVPARANGECSIPEAAY